VKIPSEWLTERVEEAPTSFHPAFSSGALQIRMVWQKLKRQSHDGDQLWAWASPPSTWKRQGKLNGYAIVRDGEVAESVTISLT
jgi:hypothetical protein